MERGKAVLSVLSMMNSGISWSREEVELAVSEYLAMLAREIRGQPFNKAEQNRNLQRLLPQRSKGSIERKHQNISAVLIEVGYPYIDGYKPLGNYQDLLREVVEARLDEDRQLSALVDAAVRQSVSTKPVSDDLLSIYVPPPIPDPERRRIRLGETPRSIFSARNYLEIEARNHSLGRAGEELVLQFEHRRLWTAGQRRLAGRIEHVSVTQGDGYGYDIRTFETDGRDRLVEVKTTRFGALTPFFASRNEVNRSTEERDKYHLYRLFKFDVDPKLFILRGAFPETCRLDAVQFTAVPQ